MRISSMLNVSHVLKLSLIAVVPALAASPLAAQADGPADCRVHTETLREIRDERVTGSLAAAEAAARRLLDCADLEPAVRLALRIELAKILDRLGLHHNTRPVAEALELVRQAEADADADDNAAQAQLALALAEIHYRAEMAEREFPDATAQARRAERLFQELGDLVGETDAVHRLGLIEMQERNLPEARVLFDRSLELARRGPRRPIFLSDYYRHVGFVHLLAGEQEDAIAHFEKSMAYRDEAGSRDYGLFARTMLGSALIDGGRPAEAGPYLEAARRVARTLPSPVGEVRAVYYLAEMHEALGDRATARSSYQQVDELAAAIGLERFSRAAREALERLGSSKRSQR